MTSSQAASCVADYRSDYNLGSASVSCAGVPRSLLAIQTHVSVQLSSKKPLLLLESAVCIATAFKREDTMRRQRTPPKSP